MYFKKITWFSQKIKYKIKRITNKHIKHSAVYLKTEFSMLFIFYLFLLFWRHALKNKLHKSYDPCCPAWYERASSASVEARKSDL